MNKKEIKKNIYPSVDLIDDTMLDSEWKKRVKDGKAKIIRFEYNKVVLYYAIAPEMYTRHTTKELYAKFIKDFIKTYNANIKDIENERKATRV